MGLKYIQHGSLLCGILSSNSKGKFLAVHAVEAYRGSRDTDPPLLTSALYGNE
jgi:hypothetical protein